MTISAHTELWRGLSNGLRLKLGDELFERWIAPLKVLSEDGSALKLGVANLFVLDWIKKRYASAIEDLLRSEGHPELALELVIDPLLYQERRREREAVFGSEPAATPAKEATREEQTLESFIVGPSNQHAMKAALEVLDRPGGLFNPLFLFGPTGVGKTHLLKGLHRALRARRRESLPEASRLRGGSRDSASRDGASQDSGSDEPRSRLPYLRVSYLTGEQFFQNYVSSIQDRTVRQFQERYRTVDVLIVDDVHVLVNKRKTQIEFLHTFSTLADSGRQVILASDCPPKGIKDLDASLAGRFSSGLVVGIKKPDFATRLGIARLQARKLSPGTGGACFDEAVLRFAAEHVRGNAREISGAIKQLHHHAQMIGGTIGLEEASVILKDLVREAARRVDFRKIHEVVAEHFGLPLEAIVSPSRQRHIAMARQVAMYLARRLTGKPLSEVGKYFGNRNHTTVKCAETKIVRLLDEPGGRWARELGALLETLEE